MKRIRTFIKATLRFLKHDIWHLRLDKLPKSKSFLIRHLRIVVLSFRGFIEDECRLRASALTYYSLMSIVPIAAMAFAVAKGFGLEKMLEDLIRDNFSENQAIVSKLLTFTNTLITEARSGVIAGIGLLVLIWAIVEILSHIEHSFNAIWHVKESKRFLRKVPEYLTLAIIAPILIIASSSAAAFILSKFNTMSQEYTLIGYIGPLLKLLLNFAPYLITWALFTVIYMVIPNTRVKFRAAIISGFIAGTVFQLTQMGYFIVQIELIDINAIYGSFAAIPLLILWLRMSWIIILFGAEMSYAIQNVQKYEYDLDVSHISQNSKKISALLIMHIIIRRFSGEETQPTAPDIARKIQLPLKLVRQIIYELINCKLIIEVKTEKEKEFAYQPAFDIHKITVQTVIERLERSGNNDVNYTGLPVCKKFHGIIEQFNQDINSNEHNKLIADIEEGE
jgi:membrane protein